MKKPILKNLPVTPAIHAAVKQDAARLGKLQYVHTGDIIIAGRRALALSRKAALATTMADVETHLAGRREKLRTGARMPAGKGAK